VAYVPPKTTLSFPLAQNRAMEISKDQELVKKTLRLPRALNEEIQAAADSHGISLNAEIVERLQASFRADELARLSSEIAEMKALIRQLLA
jgi:predicted HicB family RNase H-like nuclease